MSKTDKIQAELLAIQAKSKDKMLHPAHVVAWAEKHQTSELYAQLEWNDDKAAREYRLWQVRRLIQVHIVTEDNEPVFVSLRIDRGSKGGYRKVDDVLSSKKLSQMMLDEALDDLERVKERYRLVRQLTSVWAEVESVKAKVRAKPKAQTEARASA